MRPINRTRAIWTSVLAVLVAGSCALAEPVGVTPAQKDQLKALALETREKTMRVRDELRRARQELFQVYRVYELDERKARAAIDRISKSQLALLNLHLDNQLDLRRVLTEAQFTGFCQRMSRRFGHGEAGMLHFGDEGPLDRLPDKDLLQAVGATPEQGGRLVRLGGLREKGRVIEKLRRDSRQMIDLYSRYDLDTPAARKLIDSIHQGQSDLAAANHKAQQALRSVLTQQQFDRLQEETAKRIKAQGEHRRRFKRF